jgi:hypothetical protein
MAKKSSFLMHHISRIHAELANPALNDVFSNIDWIVQIYRTRHYYEFIAGVPGQIPPPLWVLHTLRVTGG